MNKKLLFAALLIPKKDKIKVDRHKVKHRFAANSLNILRIHAGR